MNYKNIIAFLWSSFQNIFFPASCIICGKEGSYLCADCLSLIPIEEEQYCPFCSPSRIVLDGRTCPYHRKIKKLDGLYCATTYHNQIVKKAIQSFKYSPYIKQLAQPLASLIINHLQLLEKRKKDFKDFVIIPIPLSRAKLRRRGFNQAEEIAKIIANFLNIPLYNDLLIKYRNTYSQAKLNKAERQSNIQNSFKVNLSSKHYPLMKNKKILLIDDVFTTGATMEECAKVLKREGAKQVWGMVIARE